MFVTPFGPTSHEVRGASDAAELAEETLRWMIDRSRRRQPPGARTCLVACGLQSHSRGRHSTDDRRSRPDPRRPPARRQRARRAARCR
jgi:hypothetical protein